MKKFLLRMILFFVFLSASMALAAQFNAKSKNEFVEARPYKIITNGKRITIQSKQTIQSLMVWTINGHRVLEQKEINNTNYSFEIAVNQKIFFVRVDLADGKMFTQKIGVQ